MNCANQRKSETCASWNEREMDIWIENERTGEEGCSERIVAVQVCGGVHGPRIVNWVQSKSRRNVKVFILFSCVTLPALFFPGRLCSLAAVHSFFFFTWLQLEPNFFDARVCALGQQWACIWNWFDYAAESSGTTSSGRCTWRWDTESVLLMCPHHCDTRRASFTYTSHIRSVANNGQKQFCAEPRPAASIQEPAENTVCGL